jgi:hypothetical protein
MKRKGQLDHPVVSFFIVAVMLFLLAPIMLKVFLSIQTPLSSAFGNVSGGGAIAQDNFNKVMNTGINLWDKIIIFCFFTAIILLFISAFMIDSHPFFIILYILVSFLLILFAPAITDALDTIYNSSTFTREVTYLTLTDWLRTNLIVFIVGLIFLSGIIIYGKIALFSGGTNRR